MNKQPEAILEKYLIGLHKKLVTVILYQQQKSIDALVKVEKLSIEKTHLQIEHHLYAERKP